MRLDHLLRQYDLVLGFYDTVIEHGGQCQHCQIEGRHVAANVHAVDFDGDALYAECCLTCLTSVIDRHLDIDPDHTVTVEVAA